MTSMNKEHLSFRFRIRGCCRFQSQSPICLREGLKMDANVMNIAYLQGENYSQVLIFHLFQPSSKFFVLVWLSIRFEQVFACGTHPDALFGSPHEGLNERTVEAGHVSTHDDFHQAV